MEDNHFSIQINGKEFPATEGQTILQVAKSQNYEIPSICYHPDLGTIQTCDTCFVQVEGELVRACSTKAIPGMQVDSLSKPSRMHNMKPCPAF